MATALRIPPDDPASLARAALVRKRWYRLICGRGFRRQFREFHGRKPPLGFLHQSDGLAAQAQDRFFVPMSSFKPRHHGDRRRRGVAAMHSCHGRVLLHSAPAAFTNADALEDLFVWEPIAVGEMRELPRWPLRLIEYQDP